MLLIIPLILCLAYVGILVLGMVRLVAETHRRSLAAGSPLSKSRRLAGACHHCGYNLHRNTSGICPECGTPVIDCSDLRVPGKLTCLVCGKLLGWEDRENNGLLSLPVVSLPSGEPLQSYSGLQVHRACWMRWPHRERFAKLTKSGVD